MKIISLTNNNGSWHACARVLSTTLLVIAASAAEEAPDITPADGWDNLPPVVATAGDWPWWRGPALNNHAATSSQPPPLKWSGTENVRWRCALPGKGHSTPCIVGKRIFVTSGDRKMETIWLVCLDRESGKQLWQSEVYHGALPKIHPDNSYASGTPACDGERVIIPYQTEDSLCLAAFDLEGKIVWKSTVGPYKSIQGHSSSPALYKSLVIVPADGSLGNKLTALHRKTGTVVWRASLTKGAESYASPLVTHVAGRDQVILIGGKKTHSFDPNNGKLLWTSDGPAEFCAGTAAFSKDTVFSSGGYPERTLLAIRADGSGDVTQSHLRWQSDAKAGYVPSPLLHDGLLYAVSDNGLLRCYEADSGKIVWEHALKAPFYSSPVLAGDRIYLFDREAKGYVIKTGRAFELLATNELPDGVFATPVILGGHIYLRTLRDLYCLATKP
ncbi:MAG: PQQ-binding-like beta-propeller repeat protein [Verrucomicrobiota bacterium]